MVAPIRPRYRIHKNGTASISGIPENMLNNLVTIASLYGYDHEFTPEPTTETELYVGQNAIVARNNRREEAWHKDRRWLLDRLHKLRDEEVTRFNAEYFRRKVSTKKARNPPEKNK
jgi:hypothetical protein